MPVDNIPPVCPHCGAFVDLQDPTCHNCDSSPTEETPNYCPSGFYEVVLSDEYIRGMREDMVGSWSRGVQVLMSDQVVRPVYYCQEVEMPEPSQPVVAFTEQTEAEAPPEGASCFECGRVIDTSTGEGQEWYYTFHDSPRAVCRSCRESLSYVYRLCGECNRVVRRIHHVYDDRGLDTGMQMCDNCLADNELEVCEECGCAYPEHQMEDTMCPTCHESLRLQDAIHGYHCAPKTNAWWGGGRGEAGKRFHGFELEVEWNHPGYDSDKLRELAAEFKSMWPEGYVYIEHDGSLNNGFEIITAPQTLAHFRKEANRWAEALHWLKDHDFISHSTSSCGLHVHMGREHFGNLESVRNLNITKLLYIYEVFWTDILRLSRRSASSAREWADRYFTTDLKDLDGIVNRKGDCARYRAINLDPDNTVEFRIFRGTLIPETLIGTIEFVHAMAQSARNLSVGSIQKVSSLRDFLERGTQGHLRKEAVDLLDARSIR